ncbi:uncharacterized protein LOC124455038 isoform X3 [Xenia sp. Carnegie-2017]|uniref:uncharacterized protein LOC124455038 isoform X3 n=1 Tax=Xenia sp. Carnegie-2017 TaxID=2897299 RepID=UPI001F04182F|nr:uncharacterized protein LOC124455038 isoform X3 [Xenia sp. Carnegie-2017]
MERRTMIIIFVLANVVIVCLFTLRSRDQDQHAFKTAKKTGESKRYYVRKFSKTAKSIVINYYKKRYVDRKGEDKNVEPVKDVEKMGKNAKDVDKSFVQNFSKTAKSIVKNVYKKKYVDRKGEDKNVDDLKDVKKIEKNAKNVDKSFDDLTTSSTNTKPQSTKGITKLQNCTRRKHYFDDILVVMIYHYPYYDTIPMLKSYYEDAFKNLIICGSEASPSHEIMVVDIHIGYYGYECIGEAIRRHPNYTGYLYMNDDTLVNWWTFLKLDKDKIWHGGGVSNEKESHEFGHRPLSTVWMWWKHSAIPCEETYEEIKRSYNHNSIINITQLVQTHLTNGNGKLYCVKGWSDLFYVPGRLSQQFQRISSIFHKRRVFLEMAVPTMFTLLELKKFWEMPHGTYLPDKYGFLNFADGKIVWENYNFDLYFIHPVKFHGEVAKTSQENLKKIVIPYSKLLLTC